jgi:hypothetical protein
MNTTELIKQLREADPTGRREMWVWVEAPDGEEFTKMVAQPVDYVSLDANGDVSIWGEA